MIRHMRHGSPPRLMALQSILSPNRRESPPTPSAGVRISHPAARAQERAVRDVTPPGVSRVFRSTLAVPDPEPPSTPQEPQPPRMLDNIRPQTDGSLRSGALVFHLAGVQVPPTHRLCTTSAGARWTCG